MTGPQLLIGFGAAILIPYMNVFFKDRFNIRDSLLGIALQPLSLLIAIASIVGPWFSTRLGGKVRAVVATQFGSLVFLLLTGFAPFLWLSSIGFLLRTALMNMSCAFVFRLLHGAHARSASGICEQRLEPFLEHRLGGGSLVSGFVQERYGFTPLFIATAILYALAIMLTWSFFKDTESVPISPQSVVPSPEFVE